MKREKLLSVFLVFTMILSLMPVMALPAMAADTKWALVGNAGFSAGTVSYTSLFVYEGTPYVAYQDSGNSNKATVMQYVDGSWKTVGNAGFSAGTVYYMSLYVYDGTPYVAYDDGGNGYKATVMKYDGNNWTNVGDADFSEGSAFYTSLCVYGGTPYLAYEDGSAGNKATVMKYSDNAWTAVGSPDFSNGSAGFISLKVYNGIPYVAYQDSGNSYKATVMSCGETGWNTVGSAGISAGRAAYISLDVDGGIPYVAYQDEGNSSEASVMKYNGSEWESVGSTGPSQDTASCESLDVYEGTPYLSYRDNNNKATVMKYSDSGWETVGGAGISAGEIADTSLCVNAGTPYVAYADANSSNKATVMVYSALQAVVEGPDYTVSKNANGKFIVNDGATPYDNLAAALAVCTSAGADSELVIQLGSADVPLELKEDFPTDNSASANDLISATYTGNVKIIAGDNGSRTGLRIPANRQVTFRDLTVSNGPGTATDLDVIYLTNSTPGQTLNIEGNTNITATGTSGYCVYNCGTGTVNMTGGTLSAEGISGVAIRNDSGTVNVSGGTVKSSGSSGIAVSNRKTLTVSGTAELTAVNQTIDNDGGAVTVSGGTVEASTGEAAIYSYNSPSTVDITGGVITGITGAVSNAGGSHVNISGGTVSCTDAASSGAAIFSGGTGSVVTVSGNASVTAVKCAIDNEDHSKITVSGGTISQTADNQAALKNAGNGSVEITGGTIQAGGIGATAVSNESSGSVQISGTAAIQTTSTFNGIALKNADTGSVSIWGGTLTANGNGATVVKNGKVGGEIDIYGGELQAAGTTLPESVLDNCGTVKIYGGTLTNKSATEQSSTIYQRDTGSITFSSLPVSPEFPSGDFPTIDSASDYTIVMVSADSDGAANIQYFGTTIYDSAAAGLVITGKTDANVHKIDSGSYHDAQLKAVVTDTGKVFKEWTSDADHSTSISTANPVTISALNSGASIYLLVGIPLQIAKGQVSRTSDTSATVSFASSAPGWYYYQVVGDDAGEPNIDTSGTGTQVVTQVTTITLSSLTAGAKEIYIQLKDATGALSNKLKIDIPAYSPDGTTWNGSAMPFTIGNGVGDTEANPVIIDTAGKLAYLAQQVNAGQSYSGKYFKLTENLNLDNLQWTPIGYSANGSKCFSGSFDGNGKTISNVAIGTSASPVQSHNGLFGCVSQAVLVDLGVEQVNYYTSVSGGGSEIFGIGGLVGAAVQSSIENCHTTGTLHGSGGTAGGLVGDSCGCSVKNSWSSVTITAISSGYSIAGGLVGANENLAYQNIPADSVIENCFSTGSVTGIYAGGLVGANKSMSDSSPAHIRNCFAVGSVSGTNAGGFAGANSTADNAGIAEIENCYWNKTANAQGVGKVEGQASGTATDLTATQMTSAAGQSGALIDLMNANKGSTHGDWFSWGQSADANGGYPTLVPPSSGGNVEEDIAAAKALLPESFTAAEGSVTNLLNYLNEISGMSGKGVTLTLDSQNANVANDGTIHYTAGQVTGNVVVHITKAGGTEETKTIAVAIPAHTANNGGGSSAPTGGATVVVGGKTQTAGTVSTTTQNGKTTTTVTLSTDKLKDILESSGSGATVTIPVTTGSNTVSGKLDGQAVKELEAKDATLVIETGTASYTLPASEIAIGSVSEKFGKSVSLSDISVSVSISAPSDSMVKVVKDAASEGGYSIQVPPVEFAVCCTYGGQTVEVSNFNAYVERLLAIPDGVDAGKITTAVVVEPNGSTHHVPTEVTVINGKYYAKINSLTNSVYSVIYNPVTFSDVETHWAKAAVNDMGSRLVVSGVGNNSYDPDRSITRAEFAAIMVKALGLEPGTGTNHFSDVTATDWFCGCVETAASYGIIKGYNASTFGPNDTITREQAMAMLSGAMKITGLKAGLDKGDVSGLLGKYADGTSVSSYAKESIAACLKTGVVSGTSANLIAPKAYVTRAEVAVMSEKLLQKSGLI